MNGKYRVTLRTLSTALGLAGVAFPLLGTPLTRPTAGPVLLIVPASWASADIRNHCGSRTRRCRGCGPLIIARTLYGLKDAPRSFT